MSYPNFDLDYEGPGRQAELFSADLRAGLQDGRVQVKHDRLVNQTGNIYIEESVWSNRKGDWVASGIADPDASPLWVYQLADTGLTLVFDIDTLRHIAHHPRMSFPGSETDGSNPSHGRKLKLSRVFVPGRMGRYA